MSDYCTCPICLEVGGADPDELRAQLEAVTRERDEAQEDASEAHGRAVAADKAAREAEGRSKLWAKKARENAKERDAALERERALREALGRVRVLLDCAGGAAQREAAGIIDALNKSLS